MKRLLYPIMMALFFCNAGFATADECEVPDGATETENLILKRLCNVESELKAVNKKLDTIKPKSNINGIYGAFVFRDRTCPICTTKPYSPECLVCRQKPFKNGVRVEGGGLNPCSNMAGSAQALCNEKLLQNFINPLPSPFDPNVQPPQLDFSQ